MGDGPIFIGGLSYSGKTQLRLMLNAHPNLVITRRTYLWPRHYNRYGSLERDENLAAALDAMLADPNIRALLSNRQRIETEFRAGPHTYANLFNVFYTNYVQTVGKRRWGDQLGRAERFARPIFASFPQARFIHMVRNPHDRFAVTRAMSRGRRGKLGWETAQWRNSIELAKSNTSRYLGRYLTVRYEDLVNDTERTVQAVCAFLEESFYPAMLPGAPESSLDRKIWRDDATSLTAREMAYVEHRVGPAMKALGYRLQQPALSLAERLLLGVVDVPLNAGGALAWRLFGMGVAPEPTLTQPNPT